MSKKKTITVLLIEDTPEYAELVQRWLSSRGETEFLLNWTDSLTAGLERLARGGVDVILLDLGLPDSNGLETFTAARVHAAGVPIVLLSGSDTESLALEMVREGAQDYLVKSACTSELLVKAIQYAILRASGQTGNAGEQCRVIGVLGTKGGVGATTVACALALELRLQTDQAVLLADLDVSAGLVGFYMNTKTEYSVLDAASNVVRLDQSLWEGMVAHAAGDLNIVGSPGLLGALEPEAEKLRDVLTVVRGFYRWIVVDLGRLNGLSMALLERVHELALVTTSSLPALFEAKRAIGAVMQAGIEPDRLRLVVNQDRNTQGLKGNELTKMLGVPVYASLPDAGQELQDACALGQLMPKTGDFRKQIASLTRKLAGLPEPKHKSKVVQFLSFGQKSRPDASVAASKVGV